MMAHLKIRPMKRQDDDKPVSNGSRTKPANRRLRAEGGNGDRPTASAGPSQATLWAVLGSLLGFRRASPRADHDRGQLADKRRWTFEWPAEVLAREHVAPIEQFAVWLRENGRRELTRRQLVSQYWEWIDVTETRPISWQAFDRSLRDAGIQKFRLSRGTREYRYRVSLARPKLVARADPPALNPASGERSVA